MLYYNAIETCVYTIIVTSVNFFTFVALRQPTRCKKKTFFDGSTNHTLNVLQEDEAWLLLNLLWRAKLKI